jgi:hypothetical protein
MRSSLTIIVPSRMAGAVFGAARKPS